MKKIILGLIVLASIASCKKSKDAPVCETSVAGIAGNYKITKAIVSVAGFPDTDVTSTWLDDCQKNGVYQLKADKTVVYTETGTCSGSGTGSWDVVSGKISLSTSGDSYDLASKTISGWDCSTLVVSDDLGGATYKISFSKQ